MQFSKKFRFLAASVLALQLTVPALASAEENIVDEIAPSWVMQADYVALGDSLAHGMNEVGAIGLGYTDFIAQTLKKEGLITSYSKDFAYSGYTTKNVLNDLQADVEKPITGFGYKSEKASIRASIKDAEIVTLTVGANDLLPLLKEATATGINMETIVKASTETMTNYASILMEIKKLNPKAEIYVMGYYNSFPYYEEKLQSQFKSLLGIMNGSIKMTAEKVGAIFVPTANIVATNVASYLPNPENIHLSEAGYQAVANEAFLPIIKNSKLWDITSNLSVTLEGMTTAHVSWAAATDNVGVTQYKVYVNDELLETVAAEETAITLEDFTENTAYTVTVKAVDAAGNESVESPSATFTTSGAPQFTDTENHWALPYIQKASATGIMKGYADGSFKPELAVSRVQATAILVRSLGLTTSETAPFTDISNYDAETQAEIAAAYAAGLVKGTDGKFNPSQPVTRAQLALMINRAYDLQTKQAYVVKGEVPFTDIASYNDETKRAIAMLYEFGIVTGSNGKFSPADSTKRSHAAKILVSFGELLQK
ncbi:N-acetylmuramoyl-L-alanine amidase [Lysinibacillus contaminans]|uniref:N-acetylmuramoyl-L-alanine amidase n=1 Tax=Lysinibacillus contaminans TaxID=1293441 RepID=A0ABR5JXX1_9BACI|nr:S-layer homology domain-containing protein [Lysinibacillus contaminans]KOS67150.1 N-acetylmuramoyl-L-alanine amidase [Lysinibacillus contaminans]